MNSKRTTRQYAPPLRPLFLNSRVLTVGPSGAGVGRPSYGFPVDFASIGDAMESIPMTSPDAFLTEQWIILVTPGYYEEEIRCKPHVHVVGLNKESVFIQPPPGRPLDGQNPRRANVYLNSYCSITNVTLLNRGDSLATDYVVWGRDLFSDPQKGVHDIGLTNVDIMPLSWFPDNPNSQNLGYSRGRAILLEGDWHTVIMTSVGFSYLASDGYAVELIGNGQNADCHLIDCFFDALYINGNGGCVLIRDCIEVHLRNSLIRTDAKKEFGKDDDLAAPVPGAAVATASTGPWTNVIIEGSSLECPRPNPTGVLDVGGGTTCFFKHSSTDSRTGDGDFFQQ